jgi:hypothetical protein
MRKNNSKKLFENLYKSCYYFSIFNQQLYLKCVLLQISLFEFYKKTDSPIWKLFVESPHCFYEVKGEWSLARVTEIILTKKVHMDIDLSTKYYVLSKEASDIINKMKYAFDFFGYRKSTQTFNENSLPVTKLLPILNDHLDKISNNLPCIYPKIKSFHYPKNSIISHEYIDDLPDDDTLRYSFDQDELFNEIDKIESLLVYSTSGHRNFKVQIEEPAIPIFAQELYMTDKVPGKVLDYRINDETKIELLMKWKYLSLEDSSWVLYEHYKDYYFVKTYYLKYIKNN